MKAMVVNEFGGPEVFELAEIGKPTPGDNQLLIEVKASSVNPVDYKTRDGRTGFLAPIKPAVLHPDCAGVVTELGPGVEDFSIGDEVYCFASGLGGKPGALAEYMVADASMVAKKSTNLSFEEAAALPLVAVTAWYCLVDRSEIDESTSVFIEGGTGGVGHVAIQIAKHLGAHVSVSCGSDEKCELALSLGADQAFNYNETNAAEVFAASPSGAGYDVVFNTPGALSIDHAVGVAVFRGLIHDILGEFPGPGLFQLKWLTFVSTFAGRSIVESVEQDHVGEILREITKLVDQGKLKPLLDSEQFKFSSVARAHDYAENQGPTGKVVLTADL